jgi:hypothetical protein
LRCRRPRRRSQVQDRRLPRVDDAGQGNPARRHQEADDRRVRRLIDPCIDTQNFPELHQPSYAGISGKIKKKGKFTALSPANRHYGSVKGKLKGKKAEGTAVHPMSGLECGADVSWTAEHA